MFFTTSPTDACAPHLPARPQRCRLNAAQPPKHRQASTKNHQPWETPTNSAPKTHPATELPAQVYFAVSLEYSRNWLTHAFILRRSSDFPPISKDAKTAGRGRKAHELHTRFRLSCRTQPASSPSSDARAPVAENLAREATAVVGGEENQARHWHACGGCLGC